MADTNLKQISESGVAPKTRIADVASLNAVIKKITEADYYSALARVDVQAALDGQPPYNPRFMQDTGQEHRSNLNFQDLKRRVKREEVGYYDLTDSVPVLGFVTGPMQIPDTDPQQLFTWYMVMSEEFTTMLREWPSFDKFHQLLVQKFVSHGMGFLYFEDPYSWQWRVAGLEDFKVPRGTTANEDELDIAVAYREVTVAQLYKWCYDDAAEDDKRWNRKEVNKAILKAIDTNIVLSDGEWEKWQSVLKNNDLFVVNKAQEKVKIATAWIREYSGKISVYLTLRDGGNEDFLFKCEGLYDNVNQCFNFFPYEIGTNGLFHSSRGLAHERFSMAQTLNTLRNQSVDNAKLAGALLLQPKDQTDAEDLSVIFYGGIIYLPPNVQVQNGQLTNPSQGMLPVVQDMSLLLRDDTPGLTRANEPTSVEKTRFQVAKETAEEAVLPAAALTLFYQPWKRHLNEVWRRVRTMKDGCPGWEAVKEFRQRCKERGVPQEILMHKKTRVNPMRAIGAGSPGNRMMTLQEFMQYFGQLDATGQNNLMRDVFAHKVGYDQVDRYVPPLQMNGRTPYDAEIADLQNAAMSMGSPQVVNPNDNHLLHLESHLPSLEQDLETIESTDMNPNLVHVAVIKTQHSAKHMQGLKPDALNAVNVKEISRKFNNLAERTSAAVDRLEREQAIAAKKQKEAELEQAKQQGAAEMEQKMQPKLDQTRLKQAEHEQEMRHREEEHGQRMSMEQMDHRQELAINDAESAAQLGATPTP